MFKTQYPVVRFGTPEHMAWADFFRRNKIKQHIPDNMTVFAEWPPVNDYDLTVFVNKMANLRAEVEGGADEEIMERVDRHKFSLSHVRPYHVQPPKSYGAAA